MKLYIVYKVSAGILAVAIALCATSCKDKAQPPEPKNFKSTMTITNDKLAEYVFLEGMYKDEYFPNFLVDKCKQLLIELCVQIEAKKPSNDSELFELTHAATERINELAEEFEENGSELETIAREALGEDFAFIVEAYGFDVDIEEVIAPRDW